MKSYDEAAKAAEAMGRALFHKQVADDLVRNGKPSCQERCGQPCPGFVTVKVNGWTYCPVCGHPPAT